MDDSKAHVQMTDMSSISLQPHGVNSKMAALCDIEGCTKTATTMCTRKIGCCDMWQPCGKNLCDEHGPYDRCQSNPKTDCQLRFEKSWCCQSMTCMFVVLLIAATVFVTNMIIQQNPPLGNIKWLEFYKRTTQSDGSIILQPFFETTNTFIMLHDYDQTALQMSQQFSVVNESKIFDQPTKMVYPQAPFRPMTYQKTANTSSWYDITADPAKVNAAAPELTFNQVDIEANCKVINDLITTEINKYNDKDSSRVFLQGLGQGANMANACFMMYKGDKPLGGILPYGGMLPLSFANLAKIDPKKSVLGATPFLSSNAGQNPNLPALTATKSYSYYKHYIYDTPTGKALWNEYGNPKVFTTAKQIAGTAAIHLRSMAFFDKYLTNKADS